MEIDNNKIVAALRTVADPAAGQDLITARRISEMRIEGDNVHFTLDASGVDNDAKSAIHFKCMEVIQEIYPKAQVHVHMKQGAADGDKSGVLGQITNIIAVGSGKGGVGKSTIAVNLALGLKQKGLRVGLLDADLYGPSIPTMLGLKGQRPKVVERYGQNKITPLDFDGMPVMSIGFVVAPEQAVVLRGPRLAGIIKQFMFDCLWPQLDYMVIDLPPGTGDIQLTLVQTVPVTGAVMVTTPQDVAVADALKAINMFRMGNINVPILGIVENMSWFTPAELPDNKYYLFGQGGGEKLAAEAGAKLLMQIPLVQSVQESSDTGTPSVLATDSEGGHYFSDLADKVINATNLRNETAEPTEIVQITQQ
jgi:ATP-binding protein involved in chromosome partitioning